MRIAPVARATLALFVASVASLGSLACEPAAPPVAPVVAPPPPPPPAVSFVVPGVPDEPMPLDSRIKKGKLANGLTYYVLAHHKPEHRAQLWLAVNTGSILEDDDQRGLAHFVEHMGFNGTRRFPKQALVDFLEKSGVMFGADLNAHTSFDETVYTLQVPTDKPELVDRGVSILRDWSDGMTFDPAEVEKERGVVLEEWRLGRGAQMRLFDKQAPVIFHGSKYADRITIGNPEIIQHAPRETLVRFYKDWYRPDLMAVIAVGDFDPAQMETRIQTEFASLAPTPANARPRENVPVPPHAEPLVTIETDPEATSTDIWMTTKVPHRPLASTRDLRRYLAEALYDSMMNARFDEIRRQPGAPFLRAFSSAGHLVRTADSLGQFATVKEGSVQQGWDALLTETLRVERFGFVATELERAKSDLLKWSERAVLQRDTEDSKNFANEIVRNFLTDEEMSGPEAELALERKLLPTYTLDELNQLAKTLAVGSRVIRVTGPATMTKPTTEAILATAAAVRAKDLKPYDDGAAGAPLMAALPTPGSVVATKTIPEIGVTEWTLSNGARVVVKPTDFKADEVKLTAFAPGGTSLATDADYDSATFATAVVTQGGVGPFDATQLRKALAGKVAAATPRVGELDEGMTAQASLADIESMFQQVHLYFTAPRRDEGAIAAWRQREIEAAKDRRLSPERTFYEDLTAFYAQNHRRRQPVTPEVIQRVDADKAFAFYRSRFASASGFTFILVGNVDLSKARSLAETYLASLPAAGKGAKKETWRDIHVQRPHGVAKKTVDKGSEPKSHVSLTFHGKETWSRDTDNDMKMVGEVLRIRLREVLREDMGGVYGVSASGNIARRPKPEYAFTVSFGCAPDNIARLEKAVWDEIAAIQANGIGADYLEKVKELRRRAHETSLRENGYWERELERAYTFGDDPRLILDFESQVEKVTSDRVKAAARKYLTKGQYVLGELRPVAGVAAAAQ